MCALQNKCAQNTQNLLFLGQSVPLDYRNALQSLPAMCTSPCTVQASTGGSPSRLLFNDFTFSNTLIASMLKQLICASLHAETPHSREETENRIKKGESVASVLCSIPVQKNIFFEYAGEIQLQLFLSSLNTVPRYSNTSLQPTLRACFLKGNCKTIQ